MATLSSSYKKVFDLVGFHQLVAWGGVSVLLLLEGLTVLEVVGLAELVEDFEVDFVEDFEVDLEVDFEVDLAVDLLVDLDVEVDAEVVDARFGKQTDAWDMEVARDDEKDDDRDE